jgi:hypothetical protein
MNICASADWFGLAVGLPLGLVCGFGIHRGLMRLAIRRATERAVSRRRLPPLLLQLLWVFASYLLFVAAITLLPSPVPMPRLIAPLLLGLVVFVIARLDRSSVLRRTRMERAVAWTAGVLTWWFCHAVSSKGMAQTVWPVPGDVQVCRDFFWGVLWLPFRWIPHSWTHFPGLISSGKGILVVFLIGVPWGVAVGLGLAWLFRGLCWMLSARQEGIAIQCTK